MGKKPGFDEIIQLNERMEEFNLIIIGVHELSQYPYKKFGLSSEAADLIKLLEGKGKSILTYFGNPYGLKHIKSINEIEGVLVAYHDNELSQSYAAQAIFGGIGVNATLPVSVENLFPAGTGISTSSNGRFSYGDAEELGINSRELDEIDSIALEGIRKGAYPGCQLLVAKEGKVIYNKTFGYHTYDNKLPVLESDIYDLASITKIAASTFSVMKLQDEGKFNLDN